MTRTILVLIFILIPAVLLSAPAPQPVSGKDYQPLADRPLKMTDIWEKRFKSNNSWEEKNHCWRSDKTRRTKYWKYGGQYGTGFLWCDDPDCILCFDTVYENEPVKDNKIHR